MSLTETDTLLFFGLFLVGTMRTAAGETRLTEDVPARPQVLFFTLPQDKKGGLWSNPNDPDRARAVVRAFCNGWPAQNAEKLGRQPQDQHLSLRSGPADWER